MKSLRPGAANSYRFKHYCVETDPKNERKQRQETAQISESVLELINAASDVAQEVEDFLGCTKTVAHLRSGKSVPKTMERRVRKMCGKLQSASLCFGNGLEATLNEPTLSSTMQQLSKMADDILSLMDSVETFYFDSKINISEALRRRIRYIISHVDQARLHIIPHTNVASVITIPEPPPIILPSTTSPVLFPEEPPTDPSLNAFLEKAERRGWTVTKTMKKVLKDAGVVPLEDDPGLEESFDLLNELQSCQGSLLPDDMQMGVSQLAIISYNTKRPPESIVKKFLDPHIGYDVYLIFGSYLVVNQMAMLGIHKDLMWISDEKNKPQLNVDKFYDLHPVVAKDFPQWANLLAQTYPVQPTRLAGSHYYCPLVPNTILNSWGHGLGDWDFLTA